MTTPNSEPPALPDYFRSFDLLENLSEILHLSLLRPLPGSDQHTEVSTQKAEEANVLNDSQNPIHVRDEREKTGTPGTPSTTESHGLLLGTNRDASGPRTGRSRGETSTPAYVATITRQTYQQPTKPELKAPREMQREVVNTRPTRGYEPRKNTPGNQRPLSALPASLLRVFNVERMQPSLASEPLANKPLLSRPDEVEQTGESSWFDTSRFAVEYLQMTNHPMQYQYLPMKQASTFDFSSPRTHALIPAENTNANKEPYGMPGRNSSQKPVAATPYANTNDGTRYGDSRPYNESKTVHVNITRPLIETLLVQSQLSANDSDIKGRVEEVLLEIINSAVSIL